MKEKVAEIFLAFLLCIGSLGQAKSEEVNVAWTGENWTTLPFTIGAARGFFAKEGLKPRFITFRGTNLILTALMAGEIDYGTTIASIAVAAARGLPVKLVAASVRGSGYSVISRPEVASIKGLKGKKIAISSFGSASDYAMYRLLSRSGLDPERDVTFLAIGGTSERFASLVGGSVDATAASSPFEYKAEKQGLKTLVTVKDLAEIVEVPNLGVGVAQRKIEKEPDQIVRFLRALRASILFIRERRDIVTGLLEKALRLDPTAAESFYPLYRDQYNAELTVPDKVLDEFLFMANFRLKDKDKGLPKTQAIRDWRFAESAKR